MVNTAWRNCSNAWTLKKKEENKLREEKKQEKAHRGSVQSTEEQSVHK
jgi:hypothetical protein